MKHPNIQIIGIPEGEETNMGMDNLFQETQKKHFPCLESHSNIETQEIQGSPNRINPRKSSPQHVVIARLPKSTDKGKILTLGREKHEVICKVYTVRVTADLSSDTMQARKEWGNIFKALNEEQF